MVDAPITFASELMPPLVELCQIEKSYSGVSVLKGAHLAVGAGEIHGLVGENGAGKSTLVKILAGEVKSDGGEIVWLGKPANLTTRHDAERLGITMIHQELNLAPHLTVAQNLFLGHEPGRCGLLDRRQEERQTQASLERLGFDLDPRTPVRRLSPAQRQLVEIARAVARARSLVIMDEPTSSLSAKEADELFHAIEQLKMGGIAAIFVTHRLKELATFADRVTVLRDGETVYEGPTPRSDFGELIRAMVGRELKDFYPSRSSRRGEVALEVQGLCRVRDSRARGFEGISFSLRHGEIVGLAGLVGAGRTELVESLFGVLPPDTGKIVIDGQQVSIRSPQDAIRLGIALITEDRQRTGLAMNLSVAQNITLANLSAILHSGVLDLQQEQRVARDFLDRLKIRARSIEQKVSRLSGGNQQKVVLAKWLFRQGRIFIFDEPTRGIDVGVKAEIYRLMNQLAESGAAVLMVSSELPEILGLADRVLVMRNGRLAMELETAKTTQEEIMRYATLGE
jgi:ABC-type sugar transport system ATPase subunit